MTLRSVCTQAAVAAAFAVAVVCYRGAFAAAPKAKTRAAETKYLMKGIAQVNCAALGKALKDAGPADDDAWDAAVCLASLLNELSYSLTDDGRCPDKAWADAAKTLREGSAKVLEAAKAKNLADTQAAFKGMTAACAACHKEHKK